MNTPAATAVLPAGRETSDSLWMYALFALVATAGFYYVNIMGAIVDGLVTGLRFSTVQAGNVAAANIYGASVGALLAVFVVRSFRWRPTLATLLCALLVIDIASLGIGDPVALVAVRALHGLVGGTAVGVTYSVMARLRSPDRAFGMLLVVQQGLGGLGLMFLPRLVPIYGARVLFVALAALTAIALVGMSALPRIADAPRCEQAVPTTPSGRLKATAVIALLALFLFQAGNMALAAFIIGLGENFFLPREFISQAIGWSTWIGAIGAVLVIALGTRLGRLGPLLAAALVTLLGTTAFFWSSSHVVFFAANVVTGITWAFVVPYLFGMLSRLHVSGSLATLGGFASKLGLASGPLAAGILLKAGNYNHLIGMSLGVLTLAVTAALLAARRVDAMERAR